MGRAGLEVYGTIGSNASTVPQRKERGRPAPGFALCFEPLPRAPRCPQLAHCVVRQSYTALEAAAAHRRCRRCSSLPPPPPRSAPPDG